MKLAIVGCGAAGATAAQFARKYDRKASIVVFDNEGYGEYSKCALPMVISGELSWNDVIEYSPRWFKNAKIDYRNEEVHKIDFDSKIIEANEEVEYDKIVIATGAMASIPFKMQGAYTLRNMKDAIEIKKIAEKSKDAIVIGAGLIGLEVAESLMSLGLKVKILEYMPSILPAMVDEDVANYLLKKIDIDVETKCRVKEVYNNIVEADENYEADFVVVATGNKASVEICNKCRIEKGIVVGDDCKAMEDVYAAGDCTQIKDFFGRIMPVGLGSIATRQGMIAGINAAGGNEKLLPPLWAKTTKLFNIEIASVGLMEKDVNIHSKFIGNLLPAYMKGDKILIKLLADEDGVIVGAQAVGNGASLHINKIALAIYKKMKINELARIETTYAPKVAPVFDAVTIASQMIEARMRK